MNQQPTAAAMPAPESFLRTKHQQAARVRDELMKSLGITPEAFARTGRRGLYDLRGGLNRDPKAVKQRAALFAALRAHPSAPSYPTIALVCGMTGHAGIHEAIVRYKKARKATTRPIGCVQADGNVGTRGVVLNKAS